MPDIRKEKTVVLFAPSRDSGNKCRNALPINAPAEKPTRQKRTLCNNLSFTERVKIPTKDKILTKKVLARITISVIWT
jgi:hypothetical protein